MLVMGALCMVVVLAFAAVAIDVGVWLQIRTKLQADVDAMALAGALDLCGTSACETTAGTAADTKGPENGLTSGDWTVTFGVDCGGTASNLHDLITVRASRNQPSILARIIGVTDADIATCATARKYALGGSDGVRPFALEDDCIAAITYGSEVILKYDSDTTRVCDSTNGNYAAVAIDGSGASTYRETIKYGSDDYLCADTTPGCCTHEMSGCIGRYNIDTETGNMTGPTREGIQYLYTNTPSNCDTWDEVTTDDGDIETACTPWKEGYSAVGTRIIIIPVVDGLWDSGGRHTVRIKRFALVFLEGFDGSCTGNDCDIRARFIKTTLTLPNAARVPLFAGADLTVAVLTY
jgi:hypothetical protein